MDGPTRPVREKRVVYSSRCPAPEGATIEQLISLCEAAVVRPAPLMSVITVTKRTFINVSAFCMC